MLPSPRQINSYTSEKIIVGTTISFELVTSFLEAKAKVLVERGSSSTLPTLKMERRAMTTSELLEVGP
jgi:hypothetical protein